MNWIGNIVLILVFTLVVAFISYYFFGVKGPWESYWIKTILLFLFLLAASLWIRPVGPTWYGVQWLVLVIGALLFILLLAAFSSSYDDSHKIPTRLSLMERKRLAREYSKERKAMILSIGVMFWLLLLVLVIIIAAGYYLQ